MGVPPRAAFVVDKNRKPNTKLGKTRKQRKTPEQINRSFFSVKTKKTQPKIGQIHKTENPNAPFLTSPNPPSWKFSVITFILEISQRNGFWKIFVFRIEMV